MGVWYDGGCCIPGMEAWVFTDMVTIPTLRTMITAYLGYANIRA